MHAQVKAGGSDASPGRRRPTPASQMIFAKPVEKRFSPNGKGKHPPFGEGAKAQRMGYAENSADVDAACRMLQSMLHGFAECGGKRLKIKGNQLQHAAT